MCVYDRIWNKLSGGKRNTNNNQSGGLRSNGTTMGRPCNLLLGGVLALSVGGVSGQTGRQIDCIKEPSATYVFSPAKGVDSEYMFQLEV